jgi:flagellar motility protein MotE (MotC chaperone)
MSKKLLSLMFAGVFGLFLFYGGLVLLRAEDNGDEVSTKEIELSIALQQREEAVSAREKELAQREKELASVKQELDAKLEQITALQKDVEEKLAAIKQEQDAGFKNLIKVYSAMSPTKLAPLLNQMTDENVTNILRAMKAEQVALIMPKIDSEKAVRVSRLLGRFE